MPKYINHQPNEVWVHIPTDTKYSYSESSNMWQKETSIFNIDKGRHEILYSSMSPQQLADFTDLTPSSEWKKLPDGTRSWVNA